MQSISFLPAIVEVLRLLLIVVVATGSILVGVKLNYRFWRSSAYLPAMIFIGALLAAQVGLVWDASFNLVLVAFLIPVLIGCFFRFIVKGKYEAPLLFVAPAVVGVFLLFMYPLVFEFYLAFHRLNLETLGHWIRTGEIDFVGLDNFREVLFASGVTRESFLTITGRTFLWTGINLVFHVSFGLMLALLLNQKIKFIPVYRTILILPWALPQLIAVLAWRGEFHSTYGYVNQLIHIVNLMFSFEWNGNLVQPLTWFGFQPQAWLTNPTALFAAICIVNIWLGIPFMMVVLLSGLQGIPKSYYEAASIDGATRWQQFRYITIPQIKPVLLPAAILGMIWTFNNVNVVYLMTAQRGGSHGADILVSDLYKQAFVFNRYSYSAAYAVVIFFILLVLTAVWLKVSRLTDDPAR